MGVDVWAAATGEVKSSLERMKSKLKRRRARVSELEQQLEDLGDSEQDLAYSVLQGQCVWKQIREYSYNVCFFKDARQDTVLLGNWKRWEAPHVALFDGGQMCTGGPARSLRVKIKCGATEEMADVSEPSRCAYEATLKHPAACTQDLVQALMSERGPRMPTEEL